MFLQAIAHAIGEFIAQRFFDDEYIRTVLKKSVNPRLSIGGTAHFFNSDSRERQVQRRGQ